MDSKQDDKTKAKRIASLGGAARSASLTSERKTEIARKGGIAKAMAKLPRATHEGPLKIGDIEFACSVLEDQTRVISQRGFMEGMDMNRGGRMAKVELEEGGARVPIHLGFKNLKPFISKHISVVSEPLEYRTMDGIVAHGIRADLIPKICEVWLDARAAGVLKSAQLDVAARAELLLRGLATVGIIALVDEATGYQNQRDRNALQAILEAYLRHELAAWAKRFPEEFYRQIFRLRGWEWRGMHVNRPQVVAAYTKDFVYARLAPGILTELEKRLPVDAETGRRKGKFHQMLTDEVGHPALAQHLHAVIGLMRVSQSWGHFVGMINVAFPKRGDTLSMPFMSDLPQMRD